ncbi:acetyltransferase [Intrasporangium sp.]|uniref:acetyltransferase n=1 Tax=Intrasporangium sp. TaxID=1925024 RepID=UPI003221DF78
MTRPIVVIGCGGHGREVHDIIEAINDASPAWDFCGYLDDAPDPTNVALVKARGSAVLGGSAWLHAAARDIHYVIGIGSGDVRQRLDEELSSRGRAAATLVHPTASIGTQGEVGEGSVLWPGSRMTTNVHVGRHTHINQNATVGHDSVLGDYVTVNPLAALSGGVRVGDRAMIGAGSVVLQYRSLGQGCSVGAGACVVKDVPTETVVKGVPAR